MTTFVIDASVALKWFLPEVEAEPARRVLAARPNLVAPDLLFAEAGNALWKRVRAEEMTAGEATAVAEALAALPWRVLGAQSLLAPALEIACRTGCTVYDSLYVAAAVREEAPLVTADRRLLDALAPGPLSTCVLWVADAARA